MSVYEHLMFAYGQKKLQNINPKFGHLTKHDAHKNSIKQVEDPQKAILKNKK